MRSLIRVGNFQSVENSAHLGKVIAAVIVEVIGNPWQLLDDGLVGRNLAIEHTQGVSLARRWQSAQS